jgi:hypothetical protein
MRNVYQIYRMSNILIQSHISYIYLFGGKSLLLLKLQIQNKNYSREKVKFIDL